MLSLILLFCATASAQTLPADSAAAAVAEVRESFDRREFAQTIRQANRTVALKSITPAQRHELLYFKAEAHLRLGDSDLAARAYDEALLTAPDEVSAASDRAMAMLIRRSRRNVYRSTAVEGSIDESYPIVEDAGRKAALAALWADEHAASQTIFDAAADASDLPPILIGLDTALLLRSLELTATGQTRESQPQLEFLADRARDIIKPQLKKMSSRVDKLDKAANTKKKMASAYRKRGLSGQEKSELREIAQTSTQFCDAADRFITAPISDSDDFTELRRDARELGQRAQRVANADYSGLYDRN